MKGGLSDAPPPSSTLSAPAPTIFIIIHHRTLYPATNGSLQGDPRNMKVLIEYEVHKLKSKQSREVCPNYGHLALTLSFTEYKFLQVKNDFKTLVIGLPVLKLFNISKSDLFIFV